MSSRVPAYREPKPPPHRRSHENQGNRHSYHSQDNERDKRHSQTMNHAENNNGPVHRHPRFHRRQRDNTTVDHLTGDKHAKRQIGTFEAHFVAAVGEFVGTFMFLYFSFAGQLMITTQSAPAPNGQASAQQNIFTALLYGFSLLVNVWAFYRISGGLFNPAVRLPSSSFA